MYLYNSGLLMQETIGDQILDYSYTPGGQIISVRYKANANATPVYYYYALNSHGDVNFKNGPHYHLLGMGHYLPGIDEVPEPFASFFFPFN